jgi:hypothetical protein
MLRSLAIIVLFSWISLLAMPLFASLQDPAACCEVCKGNFCPMKKAAKQDHACHHPQSNCKMSAACNHSKDAVLFTFDALLPNATVDYKTASSMLLENAIVLQPPQSLRIDIPPPRSLAS